MSLIFTRADTLQVFSKFQLKFLNENQYHKMKKKNCLF